MGESGCGFKATLVSNNREETAEMTKAIVAGCDALSVALGTTMQRV
tara:strand:+ start:322 stop:459 length:138 start_codon:yes stop_codon:yes gene_type:complete